MLKNQKTGEGVAHHELLINTEVYYVEMFELFRGFCRGRPCLSFLGGAFHSYLLTRRCDCMVAHCSREMVCFVGILK